jgi:hypothetical protein
MSPNKVTKSAQSLHRALAAVGMITPTKQPETLSKEPRSPSEVKRIEQIFAAMVGSTWWMDHAIKVSCEPGNGEPADFLADSAVYYADALQKRLNRA